MRFILIMVATVLGTTPAVAQDKTKFWSLEKKKAAFSNEPLWDARVHAKDGLGGGRIAVFCSKGSKFWFVVETGNYIGPSHKEPHLNFKYQFDMQPVKEIRLTGRGKTLNGEDINSDFIDGLLKGGDTLMVRSFSSLSKNYKEAIFTLNGAAEAVGKVVNECSKE